jgi:hypothetical protein
MGLLRGVARTAAIAGTATAVSNRVSRRQAGRWQKQADQEEYEQSQQQQQGPPQQQYVAAPVPAEPAADDMQTKLDALKQLGELKTAGVLTDEEFQRQKAKILG